MSRDAKTKGIRRRETLSRGPGNKMTESDVRTALHGLAEDAARLIYKTGEGLEAYRGGIALFNPERDERFTHLPSFATAVNTLDALPQVQAQCGLGESKRLVLQFIYALCRNLENPVFDEKAFEAIWAALWQELSVGEWTHIGVSNLQNFCGESGVVDLGDGISIRTRSFEELGPLLGWGERELAQLSDDWHQGAFGSHVLLVEHKTPKSPDNFIAIDQYHIWTKAQRALLALRLIKPGDVRIGRMFLARPAAFNVGLGGSISSGFTVWHPGQEYRLEASEITSIRAMHDLLIQFEAKHRETLRNIDVALRSFSSIYERYSHQAEDRVVDAITALEALLGESTEIAFKLAFRAAGILAADDEERVAIFERMKIYYDTRSRIVHGGVLKEKQLQVIRNPRPLLDIVRQLLVAFLRLVDSSYILHLENFKDEIDSILQHAQRRAELRKAMGMI